MIDFSFDKEEVKIDFSAWDKEIEESLNKKIDLDVGDFYMLEILAEHLGLTTKEAFHICVNSYVDKVLEKIEKNKKDN